MSSSWNPSSKHQESLYQQVRVAIWVYDQQEIDLVEEKNGKLVSFEAKWSVKARPLPLVAWQRSYPDATFQLVTPDNYLDFIL